MSYPRQKTCVGMCRITRTPMTGLNVSFMLQNFPHCTHHIRETVYDYENCFVSNRKKYDRSNSFAFNYGLDGIQFGS